MENESIVKNVNELREEVNDLKNLVENISTLLNKKLIKELYKRAEDIDKGEYYIITKEFINKEGFIVSSDL